MSVRTDFSDKSEEIQYQHTGDSHLREDPIPSSLSDKVFVLEDGVKISHDMRQLDPSESTPLMDMAARVERSAWSRMSGWAKFFSVITFGIFYAIWGCCYTSVDEDMSESIVGHSESKSSALLGRAEVGSESTKAFIRSIETPVEKRYVAGSRDEGSFNREDVPMLQSEVGGSKKIASLKDGRALHLLSQFHSPMTGNFHQYQLRDLHGRKVEGTLEEKAQVFADWAGMSIGEAFAEPSLANPMSIMQSLLMQQLMNPMTSVEMEQLTGIYMEAMDSGVQIPAQLPYEVDPGQTRIQLLPNREVQATWETTVNFPSGQSKTYVMEQRMRIIPQQDGHCVIEMTRSANVPERF